MIESGVAGLSLFFWHGLWTTVGTPKGVVDRLVDAVQMTLADPSVRLCARCAPHGDIPAQSAESEALATYHKVETANGGQ